MGAWMSLFSALIGKLDLDFVLSFVFPAIAELPTLKNPFPKRKRGNRLITSLAHALGERGFDSENMILKIVLAICHDTNYKIRMDGIQFFKEYLKIPENFMSRRFQATYVNELIEFLNDEEAYIRIEAIEIVTEVLDELDEEVIEREYIPALMSIMDIANEDITLKFSSIMGKIAFKLKKFESSRLVNRNSDDITAVNYKAKLIDFFIQACSHKELEMRINAAYNFPCFYILYKD